MLMQLDNFISGKWIKHPTGYRYFLPEPINGEWFWKDPSINKLLEQAAIKLGELNSYSKLVPNINLFIQLHVTKEAVISSRIEGTQTHIDEALLDEEEIAPERRNDWREVKNYVEALNTAIKDLDKLPISSRLLKQTHKILLQNVRGEHKLPGEYRRSQNWIGGNSLSDALFIPPAQEFIEELMADLENFIHNEHICVPELVKVAIAHYQFETIHPFLDGNGRIGRLLITLFLVEKQILQKPLLYLSSYFEQNRSLYYDKLTLVRTKNDMKQWLKYFLLGIAQTAEKATQTLSQILELKANLENTISHQFGKKSANALKLLHALFEKPVTQVKQAEKILGTSYKTANDLVADFVTVGILKELTEQSRNRIFVFEDYINLFRPN